MRMFTNIRVVGHGRVGSAVDARVRERGLVSLAEPDLVVLCVPDAHIAEVAASIATGPWIAHVSGATPVTALAPHTRRFTMHPLQTFTRARGAEQLDGAWAAVAAETDAGVARGMWLAGQLGLRPVEIDEAARVLYHASATIASNYLVTLFRAASRLLADTGVPAAALVPLMQRTIDNGFDLTGPIARGDWVTVEAHLAAIGDAAPGLVPMYRALARATAEVAAP
jgi:predicted short-subunit dehydrogenase-like oxidoreductase (DUF2520 family)